MLVRGPEQSGPALRWLGCQAVRCLHEQCDAALASGIGDAPYRPRESCFTLVAVRRPQAGGRMFRFALRRGTNHLGNCWRWCGHGNERRGAASKLLRVTKTHQARHTSRLNAMTWAETSLPNRAFSIKINFGLGNTSNTLCKNKKRLRHTHWSTKKNMSK